MVRIKLSSWTATVVAFLVLLQSESTSSANILAVFAFSSRSHNNIYTSITKALAQRGHHFTVITSVPIDSPPPNYKQINLYKDMEEHFHLFNVTEKKSLLNMIWHLRTMTGDICNKTFNNPEVNKLLNPSESGERFDLIMASNFFSECFYAFAHVYKVPVVLISPGGPMVTTYGIVGNVALPSYVAHSVAGYSDRMTFPQRIMNTLTTWGFSLFYHLVILRNMESVMKEKFGENIPSISELEKHVSLILMNHHFSLNGARPMVPSLIEIGGIHINPPKELPKDLKSFIDGAGKDGVIYFSLGSNLKSSQFPVETRDAFVSAFSQFKQRVLWKWESDTPIPGKPANVRVEKWLPQQDILAHPNVKLFITHGGMLSFQEAVSRGVPLIGIPYFGDQDSNLKRAIELGVGAELNPNNLTKQNILDAINKVLGDSIYSTNMKKLQYIVKDQINDPLERAVYWIEYVLRHKGAEHIKAASVDLTWYQLYMLDVLFVIVVIPHIFFFIIAYIIMKMLRRKCHLKKNAADTSKKEQ